MDIEKQQSASKELGGPLPESQKYSGHRPKSTKRRLGKTIARCAGLLVLLCVLKSFTGKYGPKFEHPIWRLSSQNFPNPHHPPLSVKEREELFL